MAVVANRQTEIMQGDNGAVAGRVVDTVVNERTGFATQHERVVEAEEDEDGNTKIEIKERTRTYKLPPMIRNAGRRVSTIAAPQGDQEEEYRVCSLCNFCCKLCFLPCMLSRTFLFGFVICVLATAVIFIGIIAAGPILCNSTADVPTSNVTDVPVTISPAGAVSIALTIPVVFIVLLCVCAYGYKGDNHSSCRAIIYCCNCLAILVLLSLLIPASVLVYLPKENSNSDCIYLEAPITAVGFTYAFIILTCSSWFVCCCAYSIGARDEYDSI